MSAEIQSPNLETQGLPTVIPSLCLLFPDRSDPERGWLFRKSQVLKYAQSGVVFHDQNLLVFVSEQCVASGRLMQIAVSQYNSVAHGMHGCGFDSRSIPAWMFLSCAFSAIDAMVSAIAAIVSGRVPDEEQIPSVARFCEYMKDSGCVNHPICEKVKQLAGFEWYRDLSLARHRIVHRGYWPLRSWMISDDQWLLVQSAYLFGESRNGDRDHPLPSLSRGNPIDMPKLIRGVLWELERWEESIAPIMESSDFVKTNGTEPVKQVICLNQSDHMLPEACYLKAENDLGFLQL